MLEFDCDVAIVGAGAAGLAAAAELAGSGRAVLVLEARERLGGRILTRRVAGTALPLELGAEFIHGRPTATLRWLKRAAIGEAECAEQRWSMKGGRLQPAEDLFMTLKHGLGNIRKPRRDLPFAAFLDTQARRHLRPRVREFARMLVEGFDASDATRVSTLATLEEWSGGAAADAPTSRPVGGYDRIVTALAAGMDPDAQQLLLDAQVQEVRWRRGSVEIGAQRFGAPLRVRARHAIITLPLGVLQAQRGAPNAVRFAPALRAKQTALDGLGAGPVIKVLLQFSVPFWERLDAGRYRDGAFFQAPGEGFQTFWSSLPVRSSVMVAWAGGPRAVKLSGLGKGAIVAQALSSLQRVFPRERRLRHLLESSHVHDWQTDPFAQGAYSYVVAGGMSARSQLARPVQKTLFFAGEACDVENGATVAGALASGRRAAQQVLAA
jgi:monoamine oxidase